MNDFYRQMLLEAPAETKESLAGIGITFAKDYLLISAYDLSGEENSVIYVLDKAMHDHGLFQAICRVNRLDGESKDFGYTKIFTLS